MPLTPGADDDFIDKHWYRYQVRMVFPDGSVHLFRPAGEDDKYGDNYFRIYPTGWRMKDRGHCQDALNATMGWDPPTAGTNTVYYSIDGSYLRLEFEPDAPHDPNEPPTVHEITLWQDNRWTLTFPDGRQVMGVGLMADQMRNPVKRDVDLSDSNDNTTTIRIHRMLDPNGDPVDEIRDEADRTIVVDPGYQNEAAVETIEMTGAGNRTLTWTVHWGETLVRRWYDVEQKRYDEAGSTYDTSNVTHVSTGVSDDLRMVTQIVLPSQLGGLDYRFSYNGTESNPPGASYGSESRGLGEIRTVQTPWGATATYRYAKDYADTDMAANLGIADRVAGNTIKAKSLVYNDGFGNAVTENWGYRISPNSVAVVTAPGGGKTKETYDPITGLLEKVERCGEDALSPTGEDCAPSTISMITEQVWANNIPTLGPPSPQPPAPPRDSLARANPYVKTEMTTTVSAPDGVTTEITGKTAIKGFAYDKNGNLRQVDEYVWADYSAVHFNGEPTTSRPSKARSTEYTYARATPVASDARTLDSDAYYVRGAPRRTISRASTEILGGTGTRWSYRKFTYEKDANTDDAATNGNVKEEKIWDSTRGAYTDSNAITIAHTYDEFGNRETTTDGLRIKTRWTYGGIATGGGSTESNLYPTIKETAADSGVERTENYTYDFWSGALTSVTDADNGVTTRTTLDAAGRAIRVEEADGKAEERQINTWYCDVERRVIVRSDLADDVGDGELVTVTDYDQLGRVRLRRTYEGDAPPEPSGPDRRAHCTDYNSESAGIKVATRYRSAGLYSYTLISNPYRSKTDATMGWTRTTRDHLGRVVEVATFGGDALPMPWGSSDGTLTGKAMTSYDAELTTVTDPALKQRASRHDALGRLEWVYEPDSSGNLTQETRYGYNALSNLTRVTQGSQIRGFAYDSLGQLGSASNPENRPRPTDASVSYTYDANGNLKTRTDARGVITSYAYDELNRVIERRYAGGPTEARSTLRVEYDYDNCGSYSQGRLCSITAYTMEGTQEKEFSRTDFTGYDALGRVRGSVQTTDGQSYTMSYEYDRSGNLTSQTYPSGKEVETAYDGAGRIAGVRLVVGSSLSYYARVGGGTNTIGYAPHGGIEQVLLGNSLWEQRRYNSRLQPTQIGLGTGETAVGTDLGTTDSDLLLLDYSFGTTCISGTACNNGNVLGQRIRGGTLDLTQSYSYDELNRLIEADEEDNGTETWSQAYSYDRYGNRAVTGTNSYLPNGALTPQALDKFDTATNRLDGMNGGTFSVAYDLAGNLTRDWSGNGFKYDGENRMVSFDTLGTDDDTTYHYDGEGRRVKKVVGGSGGPVTIYVYNVLGQLVAEYATRWRPLSGTHYVTKDHLGSTRVVTGPDGAAVSRHDYLPFGEEILGRGGRTTALNYPADSMSGPAQKFTGKERDGESRLDYFGARYFSGAAGRFTSPDSINVTWSRLVDPANTLNKYSYAANNPLLYVDSNGQDITVYYLPLKTPSGSNPLGHIMVSVKNQRTGKEYFLDVNPSSTWEKGSPVSTTPDPEEVARASTITFNTSDEQDEKAIKAIKAAVAEQKDYCLFTNNCVIQSKEMLRAAGITLDAVSLSSPGFVYRPVPPVESWLALVWKYGFFWDYLKGGYLFGVLGGPDYSPAHYGVNLQNTEKVKNTGPFVFIFRFPRQPNKKGSAEVRLYGFRYLPDQ